MMKLEKKIGLLIFSAVIITAGLLTLVSTANNVIFLLIATILLITASGFLFYAFLQHYFIESVNKINHALQRLNKGGLSARLMLQGFLGSDDLSQTGENFNVLAKSLEEKQELTPALEKSNAELTKKLKETSGVLRKSITELSLLYEISSQLISLEFDKSASSIIEKISPLLPSTAIIYNVFVDPDSLKINFVRTKRMPLRDLELYNHEAHLEEMLQRSEKIKNAIQNNSPVLESNLDEDEDLQAFFTPLEPKALYFFPVVVKRKLHSFLLIINQEKFSLSQSETALIKTISSLITLALDNAQAYQTAVLEKRNLEIIINNINEGLLVINKKGEIIRNNALGLEILRLTQNSSPLVRPIQELIPDLGYLLQETPPASKEICLIRPNRQIKVSITSDLVDGRGDIMGKLLILKDITEEKEASRAKSDVISFISHELRTPITSIKIILALLLSDKLNLPPEIKSNLEAIEQQVDLQFSLISELLDLSRIEAGDMVIEKKPVSFSQILESVIQSLQPKIDNKKIALEINLPKNLPSIQADYLRLRQACSILLDNAVKFTPKEGKIMIECNVIEKNLQLAISDTGIGINKEDMNKIFRKFYQGDNSLKRKIGGSGLGLYIAESFIKTHGGKIWSESELNKGSTFYISLPLK